MALAGAVMLALALGPHRVADSFTESDFIGGYVEGAQGIQSGHIAASRYVVVGPVYEVTLALVEFLARDFELAGKLISVASACGMLWLWFLLIGRRAGATAGVWTLAFLAVNPILIRYGSSTTTDALAAFVQALAMLALFGGRGRSAPLWGGILAGVAFLTRFNSVYLLPAFFLSDAWRDPGPTGSRRRAAVTFAAGFAAIVAPWVAFSIASGHVPGESLFHNLAFDVFARSSGISWDEYETRLEPQIGSLSDVLSRDPLGVLRRILANASHHVVFDAEKLLGLPAAFACIVSLPLTFGGGGWRKLAPVWATAMLLYLTLVPALYSERYSLGLAPSYLSLIGLGVASSSFAFELPVIRVRLKTLAALGVLIVSAVGSVRYQRDVLKVLPVEAREAARALRGMAPPPGSRVLARKPHIGFYSGLRQIPFPTVSTLPELAAFCRKENIGFLYYSAPELLARPEFSYLLDTLADVPGLQPIAFPSVHPARLYRVGPGFGENPAWFANDSLRSLRVARALASVGAPPWRAELINGIYALQLGHFEAAIFHLTRLTVLRPDFSEGFLLQGEAFRGAGRSDRAATAYSRAVELDPGNVEAWFQRGSLRLEQGDVSGAAGEWRPIVDRTQDPAILKQMVMVFREAGDLDAARLAEAALRRGPPR